MPTYQIFGSHDSTDLDVVFFLAALPPTIEARAQSCKTFAAELRGTLNTEKTVNANIAVLAEGRIVAVHKGTPDELNNACFRTYALHKQAFPNHIHHAVPRDIPLKVARALRSTLSMFSRTQHRPVVKPALHGTIRDLHATLSELDLSAPLTLSPKSPRLPDLYKTVAFQIGQAHALLLGHEHFTKGAIAANFPALAPFLHRQAPPPPHPTLEAAKRAFLAACVPFVTEFGHLKASDLYPET